MDWISCQNIFEAISKECQSKKLRFTSPLSTAVGDFYRQISSFPEERRGAFWRQGGGLVQKWVQEELYAMGYVDQRFKFKRMKNQTELEFMAQNLTSGTPIESFGQDTVEVVLQAFYIALKDVE